MNINDPDFWLEKETYRKNNKQVIQIIHTNRI